MSQKTELMDQIVAGTAPKPPCVKTLRLPQPKRWEPGRAWAEWEVDESLFHRGGALFGGYLAAMADSALGLATLSVLNDDEAFTTSDLRVSFFRRITSGTIEIDARVVHRGRRMVHAEVLFTNEDGELAAKATATQVIVPFEGD